MGFPQVLTTGARPRVRKEPATMGFSRPPALRCAWGFLAPEGFPHSLVPLDRAAFQGFSTASGPRPHSGQEQFPWRI